MFLNRKTAATFAIATSLFLPALAHAETLQRDGVTYEYTVKEKQGRTIIAGTADRHTPFRLVVRGQRISGLYNGKPVAFSMREVKRSAEAVAVR